MNKFDKLASEIIAVKLATTIYGINLDEFISKQDIEKINNFVTRNGGSLDPDKLLHVMAVNIWGKFPYPILIDEIQLDSELTHKMPINKYFDLVSESYSNNLHKVRLQPTKRLIEFFQHG